MSEVRYTNQHEWIRLDGDEATIGITRYAAESLGDVVFVEVPEVGRKVSAEEAVAVVESVKAASDVYSPVTGEVIEANGDLAATPGLVNEDAEGKAWFFKVRLAKPAELDALMDRATYDDFAKNG